MIETENGYRSTLEALRWNGAGVDVATEGGVWAELHGVRQAGR